MIALTQPVFPKPVVYLNAFFILFFFFTLQLKPDLRVFDRSGELLPKLEEALW